MYGFVNPATNVAALTSGSTTSTWVSVSPSVSFVPPVSVVSSPVHAAADTNQAKLIVLMEPPRRRLTQQPGHGEVVLLAVRNRPFRPAFVHVGWCTVAPPANARSCSHCERKLAHPHRASACFGDDHDAGSRHARCPTGRHAVDGVDLGVARAGRGVARLARRRVGVVVVGGGGRRRRGAVRSPRVRGGARRRAPAGG